MTKTTEAQIIQAVIDLLNTEVSDPDDLAVQAEARCRAWVRETYAGMTEEELQAEYERLSELIAGHFVDQLIGS